MDNSRIFLIFGALHVVISAITLLYVRVSSTRVNMTNLVWAFCIPIFGPLASMVLAHAADSPAPDSAWLDQNIQQHNAQMGVETDVEEIVPLEEALLINDHIKRRSLIMSALRLDPVAYLDLLLIARFNEDSETAHYAASTIMELQRQMQQRLQDFDTEVRKNKNDAQKRKAYIHLLSRYCDSGLVTGTLLRRQQYLLCEMLGQMLVDIEAKCAIEAIQSMPSMSAADAAEAIEVIKSIVSIEHKKTAEARKSMEAKEMVDITEIIAEQKATVTSRIIETIEAIVDIESRVPKKVTESVANLGTQQINEAKAYYSQLVRVLLAIEIPNEARIIARRMRAKWPLHEEPYLESMRVAVKARDRNGLQHLLKCVKQTAIDWTKEGRELMLPWLEVVIP